jgi:HEAT repeat protein
MKLGLRCQPDDYSLALLDGDAAAIPVLLELMKSPYPSVRLVAVESLARMGEAARPALPALLEASDDEDNEVGSSAAIAVYRLDQDLFYESLNPGCRHRR